MSQRNSALHCRLKREKLLALRKRVQLARGYHAMSKINRELAEEMISIDNEALAQGEQKLTECEIK